MNNITWKDLDPDMRWKYAKQRMDFNKNANLYYICEKPFGHISIDVKGRCFLCGCSAWLPISVGNILDFDSLNDIQNSKISNHIQSTIINGTYSYCDLKTCGFKETGNRSTVIPKPTTTHLHLAIDSSCNLSCPSCRKEMIFIKPGNEEYSQREKMLNHIAKLIAEHDDPLSLVLFSDGEVFASSLYGDFLQKFRFKNKNSKLTIFTNGTLIKQKWYIVEHLEEHISKIQISIDAVTKPVFEKLRRGASWERLIENLDWLYENKIKIPVVFFYVTQLGNVEDMLEIPNFLERYPKYQLDMWKINDWASLENFNNHAVWDAKHPKHEEYMKNVNMILSHPRIHATKLKK